MPLPTVLLSSSTAINSSELVNVNQIVEMTKADIIDTNDVSKNQFLINFLLANTYNAKATFRYKTVALRNTAFTAISTAIAQAV